MRKILQGLKFRLAMRLRLIRFSIGLRHCSPTTAKALKAQSSRASAKASRLHVIWSSSSSLELVRLIVRRRFSSMLMALKFAHVVLGLASLVNYVSSTVRLETEITCCVCKCHNKFLDVQACQLLIAATAPSPGTNAKAAVVTGIRTWCMSYRRSCRCSEH